MIRARRKWLPSEMASTLVVWRGDVEMVFNNRKASLCEADSKRLLTLLLKQEEGGVIVY